jgi:RNA polymerase sigma factor (sigma-70 family)
MEVSTLPRSGGGFLPHPRQVLKAYSDERLVDQIRRGHDTAFDVLYERHHRAILSFCRHMLSSQEEAEDAVQQTFVNAYYDIRANDKDLRVKAWLYTIARNRCLTVLRARREQPAELDEIPTAGLSEAVHQREDLRRMLADMRDLPVEQRSALVLSELGDLSHADIAGVLGVPTLKVKSLVFQARSSLLESREARETSCVEIREQLSTLRGGALRRGPLRKHVDTCAGCQEFREEVRRQRAAIAAILPVVPSASLKGTVMAAIGGGGAAGGGAVGLGGSAVVAGGGAAAGGSAGIGGVISLLAGAGTVKVVAAAVVATGAAGGTAIVVRDEVDGAKPAPQAANRAAHAPADGSGSSTLLGYNKTPAGTTARTTKEKKAKKPKDAPTLVLNPDGTITVLPGGEEGGGSANGSGGKSGDAPGRTRGNSNGSNGTRTRAHGNPPKKGGRGRGTTPAPQAAPDVAPPPATPPPNAGPKDRTPKGDKGTKGPKEGKEPKLPKLPLP